MIASTPSTADLSSIRKSLFVDSTPLLADPIALRVRAETDGYLFFKQRVPADEILALRAELIAVLDKYGWRQPGQDALGGLVDYDAIGKPLTVCARVRAFIGAQ